MTGDVDTYLRRGQEAIACLDRHALEDAISRIAAAWERDSRVFCCGNGGSALTAAHSVADWNRLIPKGAGRRFRAHCLADSIGCLTACANDASYDDVFVEPLANWLDAGDVLVAYSGSGNSENVLRAVAHANAHGADTIGLCGFDGGKLRTMARCVVWLPVMDMQITEDFHLSFVHLVVKRLAGMSVGGLATPQASQ